MSSRLGAVTATPGPTPFKQQRSTRIVGAKNSRTQCSIKDNSFQYTIPHDDSLSGSSSASSCEPVSDFPASFRKSTYWMKMRRIKPAATSQVEGAKEKEKEKAKGKRKIKQEEDEDYRELPQKKHKLYGRKQRPKAQPHPKPQARRVRKEPPVYAAGSMEEKWYLEIMDKGSVSCPTCQAVGRKTIEGLKKHMENCKQEMFTCHHCGKQLHSLAGMKYHVMANHNSLPILKAGDEVDEPSERERLRTVLKRMGKLRCMRESCSSTFTSIMGYLYHVRKCGKEAAELEKLTLKCHHCGKPYRSKAGLAYHMRSEHGPVFFPESGQQDCLKEMSLEAKGGGRVQRRSAKIAVYHLQELASAELTKEWPKRKVLQDLVPDDRKLKYTRPGLPTFSQEVLHKWKTDIKKYHRIQCPNQGCEAVYSSVSGLKAHLGSCTLGNFVAGKYKCLLCQKEFVSESGVKYHINSVHAEDWFVVNPTTTKSFEKLMKIKQRQQEEEKQRQQQGSRRSLRRQQQPRPEQPESQPESRAGKGQGGNEELVVSAVCKGSEQEPVPAQSQKAEPTKTTHKRGRK
ncbi:zinc finger protein 512 isoform X3 [Cricetulus griseus]|uniref:Zinc finger protein 512 n=1 Tax=Cricetulus griseus TaxID=10029 RepID=A0A9J7G9R8_CRIGR|nr:zinc finger protein 512 isoform X3 [Cricetulus griseus]XP_027280239.1 zinc finger protein 512 isoform X3 [Cricetulus griseus]